MPIPRLAIRLTSRNPFLATAPVQRRSVWNSNAVGTIIAHGFRQSRPHCVTAAVPAAALCWLWWACELDSLADVTLLHTAAHSHQDYTRSERGLVVNRRSTTTSKLLSFDLSHVLPPRGLCFCLCLSVRRITQRHDDQFWRTFWRELDCD